MRRWLLLLLLVPGVAADPPADAFCVILFEAAPDFSTITITVDEETSLEEREALWPSVDLDGDGYVTPAEKEAWRWDQTRTGLAALEGKLVTIHQDAPYTKWEEQSPLYASTWRQVGHVFHHQEYRLPDRLSRPVELETQAVRVFGFETFGPEAIHITVRGGREVPPDVDASNDFEHQGRPAIEYVVVRAPPGWRVEHIEGQTYDGSFSLTPKAREVDVPAFDTQAPYAITFFHPARYEKQTDEGIPGLGVLHLAALLVGLVAWRSGGRGAS